VLGLLLAVGPPSRGTDVGVVPAAVQAPASGDGRGAAAGAVAGAGPGAASAVPGGAPTAADPTPPGTVPVAIELPDRGVGAPVVPTATGPDGALAVPDPPSTVGWWSPGALAGAAAGTTVLVGHVDSAASGLGMFAVLRDVTVGERVLLRGADGRLIAYRVTSRRQAGKAALSADLFAPGGPPRLALVTCGGRFDRATRHYTDNVVVYAVPA
jgi:Sortase domain